jgi:hypothetical protein
VGRPRLRDKENSHGMERAVTRQRYLRGKEIALIMLITDTPVSFLSCVVNKGAPQMRELVLIWVRRFIAFPEGVS